MDQEIQLLLKYQGVEYLISPKYWSKTIDYLYWGAVEFQQMVPYEDAIEFIQNVYSYENFKYYIHAVHKWKSTINSYLIDKNRHSQTARTASTTERVLLKMIPQPDFNTKTSFLRLRHWIKCRLKPAIYRILKILQLDTQELKDLHNFLTEELIFWDVVPSISLYYDNALRSGDVDINSISIQELVDAVKTIQSRDRMVFEAVYEKLRASPRREYINLYRQIEHEIILIVLKMIHQNDDNGSEDYQDVADVNTSACANSNLRKLNENSTLYDLISSLEDQDDFTIHDDETTLNLHFIPEEYYYQIDSGLIDHPVLNKPLTNPIKSTSLATFRFHHDLLNKDLELQMQNNGDNIALYDYYYKRVYFVLCKHFNKDLKESRDLVKEIMKSLKHIIEQKDYLKKSRDSFHRQLINHLEEIDCINKSASSNSNNNASKKSNKKTNINNKKMLVKRNIHSSKALVLWGGNRNQLKSS